MSLSQFVRSAGCRSRAWRRLLVLELALTIWACSSTPSAPSVVLSGLWGGEGIALTVSDSSSHVEFDCAHGDIPSAIALDARHEFSVTGTFVREHGGPVLVPPPPPDSHPASYSGSVNGDTMALTVELTDTQTPIGTFTLSRGLAGRVVKCVLPLAVSASLRFQ